MPMCPPAAVDSRRLHHSPARWKKCWHDDGNLGIPPARVRCLGHDGTRALKASLRFLSHGHVREARPAFSHAAAARARRKKTNLLLYAPYAWEAFAESSYPRHTPRKVLFQYHPHADFENRLLTEDFKRFPEMGCPMSRRPAARLPASLHDVLPTAGGRPI